MEVVLFRLLTRASEKLVAERRRADVEVDPLQLANEVLEEFRLFLQFDQHVDTLRVRIRAHIEEALRHPLDCSSSIGPEEE